MGNLGKIIVAIGFELLPKVQKIAQSGHTALRLPINGTLVAKQQAFDRWLANYCYCWIALADSSKLTLSLTNLG